jgi:hypothetical protein
LGSWVREEFSTGGEEGRENPHPELRRVRQPVQ